jgi:hypothetical protein
MDREEIIFWKGKYDREEDRYVTGTEEQLRANFHENRYVTKEDLEKIIKWKFQGRLTGRQTLNLIRLNRVEDWVIKKVTALAFEMPTDKLKLKLLMSIDSVGASVASVILTFYDPENYGVLDFHVWHSLYNTDKKIFTEQDCLKYFKDLRSLARKVSLPCRDVEKAIFKKDLDS